MVFIYIKMWYYYVVSKQKNQNYEKSIAKS